MSTLGLGIVGLNNQGLEHLHACLASSLWHIAALCDRDETTLRRAVALAGEDVPLFTDLEAMVRDPSVDAVVIALPHALHSWAVRVCATAGKPMLKEKPLGRSMSESHAILDCAAEGGVLLYTGVQRRHHGTYEALKHWLQSQPVPSSVSLTMTIVPRPGPDTAGLNWRNNAAASGGGALIDLGYHAVDLLYYLLGPVELVSCVTFIEGRPCHAGLAEDSARIHARRGSTWIRIETGRSHTKSEQLVLQWQDGRRVVADREQVHIHADGSVGVLASSPRAWTATMVDQLDDFGRRIGAGPLWPADSHEEQAPVQRFIERCYALQRIDGPAEHSS